MHSLKKPQVVYERTWTVTQWKRIWTSEDCRKYWYAKRAWKVLRRLNQDFWNKSISLKYSKKCSPKKLFRKVSSRSKFSFKRSWSHGKGNRNGCYICNVECKNLWCRYPWRWKKIGALQLLQLSCLSFCMLFVFCMMWFVIQNQNAGIQHQNSMIQNYTLLGLKNRKSCMIQNQILFFEVLEVSRKINTSQSTNQL